MTGSGPTVLFGLGATKAGTSWVHAYLASHPGCRLRHVKELHFFDAVDNDAVAQRLAVLDRKIARSEEMLGDPNAKVDHAERLRDLRALRAATEARDAAAYMAYLTEGAGEGDCVADITPSYAMLSEDRLTSMQALSGASRFLFIMREPAARLWSQIRMVAGRGAQGAGALARRAERLLSRAEAGQEPEMLARGDYAATLKRLAALDPARVMVLFFEELFSQDTMDRLCAFLGVAPHPAPVAARVHVGAPLDASPDQRRRLSALVAPQYAPVRARMGRLPEAWEETAGVSAR